VIVVMAASPCNFIVTKFEYFLRIGTLKIKLQVQPYEQSNELQNLMMELQNLLGVDKGVKLQTGEVKEGGVYAAKHHDGKWYRYSKLLRINPKAKHLTFELIYRAQVNNLLKGDHFASYLVDFGDHVVVSLDKLRVLPQNYCALPYQAVKAKVSGE
jgi:Tudor domain